MLLTERMVLEKAHSIIKESRKNVEMTEHFWIESDNGSDEDIFCYRVISKEDGFEYPPGILLPLFKRNGEITDFNLPIPAYLDRKQNPE